MTWIKFWIENDFYKFEIFFSLVELLHCEELHKPSESRTVQSYKKLHKPQISESLETPPK